MRMTLSEAVGYFHEKNSEQKLKEANRLLNQIVDVVADNFGTNEISDELALKITGMVMDYFGVEYRKE